MGSSYFIVLSDHLCTVLSRHNDHTTEMRKAEDKTYCHASIHFHIVLDTTLNTSLGHFFTSLTSTLGDDATLESHTCLGGFSYKYSVQG